MRSYDMLDFDIKFVREISGNWTLNSVKVCLGFAVYDVQLPDISLTNFLYQFSSSLV